MRIRQLFYRVESRESKPSRRFAAIRYGSREPDFVKKGTIPHFVYLLRKLEERWETSKKLKAWRKSRSLTSSVYRLTAAFPGAERYGLAAQMRRAAVSVSANLAEGCGRMGDVELRRFVRISLGSLSELECELLLAKDLQFVDAEICHQVDSEIHEIRSMLHGLHRALPVDRSRDSESVINARRSTLDSRLSTRCSL